MTVKGVSLRHAPLLARMLFWRVVLPVAKRFVTTERLVRFLAAPGNGVRSTRGEEMAVRLAGRLWRSSEGPCLERSLALYHELGRLGAGPEIVLGIGRESISSGMPGSRSTGDTCCRATSYRSSRGSPASMPRAHDPKNCASIEPQRATEGFVLLRFDVRITRLFVRASFETQRLLMNCARRGSNEPTLPEYGR